MSPIDDDDTTTVSTDILIPVDTDQNPYLWHDGNDARITGLLELTGKYYKRVGLFQLLFKHRATTVSGGRIAVDSAETIPFVLNNVVDAHDFDDPCAPTPARITKFNAKAVVDQTPSYATAIFGVKVSDDDRKSFVISEPAIEAEDGRLFRSLLRVFGGAEQASDLIEDADGSGLKFMKLLRDRAAAASPEDRAVVAAEFTRLLREGVRGDLNLSSLKTFVRSYKLAKTNQTKATRPDDAAEVQMIHLIAYQDAAVRELYRLRVAAAPPATLSSAVSMVQSILRERVRFEELDQVVNGAAAPALAAPRAPAAPPTAPAPPAAPAAAPAGGISEAALIALLAKLGVVDPSKLGGGRDKKKNDKKKGQKDIKRDAEGRAMEWVRGVHGTCGCGGEHLYRDCPRKAEKAEKAKAEAAAAKIKEQAGAGLSAIEELSTAQLEQLVASYLGSQSDAAAGSAKVAVKSATITAESLCGDTDEDE